MECSDLWTLGGVWNVDWRVTADSWDQTIWCIQEAKQVCGGRKSRHAKAKAASSLPFVQWNVDTMTSPASCASCWCWLHKCCHNMAPITTSSLHSCFSLMKPTTVRIVTRLRNGRSEVQTPESAMDFLALPTVADCLWSPPSRPLRVLGAVPVVVKRPVPDIYHSPPSHASMGKTKIHFLYLNQQQCLLRIYQTDSRWLIGDSLVAGLHYFNPLALELFFFLILAHPVYKIWIIQEPNKLALWNKLHFE